MLWCQFLDRGRFAMTVSASSIQQYQILIPGNCGPQACLLDNRQVQWSLGR